MKSSLVEPPYIPKWAKKRKETVFHIYNGTSMRPLFRPGDLLCSQVVPFEHVHKGDVVIYRRFAQKQDIHIVHRVVAIKGEGIFTKGDNNWSLDDWKTTCDSLVAKVTHYNRSQKLHQVTGGITGLYYSYIVIIIKHAWKLIEKSGWRVYRWIRERCFIGKIWRPSISKILFISPEGQITKYCHRKKTIAYWFPDQGKFHVTKPYDLVISPPVK